MKLSEQRILFTSLISDLVREITERGFSCYFGDGVARDGHIKNSFHYKGLAQDINLFKNGVYLTKTEDHAQFGEYWKQLHPLCTWGGDFTRKDGNHYSFGEK